jgi:hypothetical protein
MSRTELPSREEMRARYAQGEESVLAMYDLLLAIVLQVSSFRLFCKCHCEARSNLLAPNGGLLRENRPRNDILGIADCAPS